MIEKGIEFAYPRLIIATQKAVEQQMLKYSYDICRAIEDSSDAGVQVNFTCGYVVTKDRVEIWVTPPAVSLTKNKKEAIAKAAAQLKEAKTPCTS